MSKVVDIDGVRFESSASLAARFGYSADYVSRLAREGKVEASRMGRLWFIDTASFTRFVASTEEDKKKRSEEIRIMRQTERESYQTKTRACASGKFKLNLPPQEELVSLAQTVAVVMCGLFVGVLGWQAHQEKVSVLDAAIGLESISGQFVSVFVDGADEARFTAAAAVSSVALEGGVDSENSGEKLQEVFTELPAQIYERATSSVVTTVDPEFLPFSDPVRVEYDAAGTKIIQPIFHDGSLGTQYEYSLSEVSEVVR